MSSRVDEALRLLHEERDMVDEVIAFLERMAAAMKPRRGRPPNWLKIARQSLKKRKKGEHQKPSK